MKKLFILLLLVSSATYGQHFFKVVSAKDTITLGQDYKCTFVIDTNRVNPRHVKILFLGSELKRKGNTFQFDAKLIREGPNNLDFSILRTDKFPADTIKVSKIIIAMLPKRR